MHPIQQAPPKVHEKFEITCTLHNAFGNSLCTDDGNSMEDAAAEMQRGTDELVNDVHENEVNVTS